MRKGAGPLIVRRAVPLLLGLALASPGLPADAPPGDPRPAPTLSVPSGAPGVADSTQSAPAPLLIRGRGNPDDTLFVNRIQRAKEHFELGLALERQRAPAAAIASYRNALKLAPRLKGPNARMGRLFAAAGEYRQAATCYAGEVANDPGNAEAARELGLAFARSGDHPRAVAQLEALTRRRPGDGASWQALGFAYAAARRPRDAEAALRRAASLAPDLSSEHRDLGALLAAQGRDHEAREQYRRAIALDSSEATVWVNLGNLERRAHRSEEALRCYREAEARDASLALAYQGQIQALQDLRRDLDAGETYRRWVRHVPGDLDARLEAVRYFDGLGRRDIALELARDAVRLNEGSGDAHLILAMALESAGRTRSALAEMRKAEALSADRASADRARQMIAALRASAPDSLRGLFEADAAARTGKRRAAEK